MKPMKNLFLFLSLFALAACGTAKPQPSSEDPSSTTPSQSEQTSSGEEASSGESSSESTSSEASSESSSSESSSEEPPKEPLSTFDEITTKMDSVKKALGATMEAEEESPITPPILPAIKLARSSPIKKAPDPDPTYTESYNTGWTTSAIYNDYQIIDYIVNLFNYELNGLSNGAYGVDFEYGKSYIGEGYMELISSLNTVMKNYGLDVPKLSVQYNKTGNNIDCLSSWDYSSNAMKSAMPFWNIDILSHVKFVFNDDKELEEVYVSYVFGGIQYQVAAALFDFKNHVFYSYHAFNSQPNVYSGDYDTAKQICDERYQEFATNPNVPLCNVIRIIKIDLSSERTSDDDIQFYRRESNTLFEENRDEIVNTSSDELKNNFLTLNTEVYNKVKVNELIFNYDHSEDTPVNNVVEDAAAYGIWRATVIYNYNLRETIIPFISYDDLRKYINQLKTSASAETQEKLTGFLSAVEANEDKYVGNMFKTNEATYKLGITKGAYLEERLNISGSFYSFGEYAYGLYKNDELIIEFSVDDEGNAAVWDSTYDGYSGNIFLTNGAIELLTGKYLVVWTTDEDKNFAVSTAVMHGRRNQIVSFTTSKKIVNVIIGVYKEEVELKSFDYMMSIGEGSAPSNLDALIWLHDWGNFERDHFLESTRSNGLDYNNGMWVFGLVNDTRLDPK